MLKTNKPLLVSIIIPVFNEEKIIESLLIQLDQLNVSEIIVVDARSTDRTIEIAKRYSVKVLVSVVKQRSFQMNKGAEIAKEDYLLFLHVDVVLPENFIFVLNEAIQKGVSLANFKLKFDLDHWFLKLNTTFSRFNGSCFQFGDQGLLIKKQLFNSIGGFNEQMELAEGNDLIRRARKISTFTKLNACLIVSARKYEEYGMFRLQAMYYLLYILIRLGVNQKTVLRLNYLLINN